MTYWLALFTGETWQQFQRAGAAIVGFRSGREAVVSQIGKGDILICYVTGVQRWVGALEVLGPTEDRSPLWTVADFPVRLQVRPIVLLAPEHGVPMGELRGHVEFYETEQDRGLYRGFLRSSPNRFRRQADGQLIVELLHQARANPIVRPVPSRKLHRRPYFVVQRHFGQQLVQQEVTVPEAEPDSPDVLRESPVPPEELIETSGETSEAGRSQTRHTEIQHLLLSLGADLGLNVWVARNDRGRVWNGQPLGDMPRLLTELPNQFDDATTRTIELIDVLWLRGSTIVAAFEIECTTSVYSGILRMSDLLALQPNINIKLYLVAPDERREKVQQEIRRPTFALRDRPLPEICGFIPFSQLVDTVQQLRKLGVLASMKPEFLDQVAEYFR